MSDAEKKYAVYTFKLHTGKGGIMLIPGGVAPAVGVDNLLHKYGERLALVTVSEQGRNIPVYQG